MPTRNSFVFLGLAILLTIIATAHSGLDLTITDAEICLLKFGSLPALGSNSNHAGLLDNNMWTKVIKDLQKCAGLNVSGELDEETNKLISLPRCGVHDEMFHTENRSKRYALQGSRWRLRNITYKIINYPVNLNKAEVDAEIARAWAVWSEYTDLTFKPKNNGRLRERVHIKIRFVSKTHGCNESFDGKGGVLAHAASPHLGGDVHFDADELWTIGSPSGKNLFHAAAHEFGHALGLSHSDIKSALMSPFIRAYDSNFKLHDDDISAIQKLYGNKTTKSTIRPYVTSITPKSIANPSSVRPD